MGGLQSEILKLLFVLEKRGYVSLDKSKAQEINVTLIKKNLPNDFFQGNVFDSEYRNINDVSKKVKRIATLTLDTMLNKIYIENGVRTWA